MRLFASLLLSLLIIATQPAIAENIDSRLEIKLGATLPMTGGMSFYGEGFRNAVTMALEELGETKYRYSLTVEDNKSSAVNAVTDVQRFNSTLKPAILLSASANIALAIAPLARQYNFIHLGISSDPVYADGIHNFNIWPAPEIPARALIQEFQQRGIRKVAFFGLEHAWPRAVFQELEKLMKQTDLQVTMQEFFSPGESNMKPVLEKFRRSRSDIGVLLSWPPELETFARQYHDLKITIPLTCDFSFEASADRKLFDGFWFVNLRAPDQTYRERFQKRFGYAPYAQMELGDLMLRMVVDAYEQIGDGKTIPSSESISKELLKIKNKPSVLGNVSIRSDGVLEAPYAVKVVKAGAIKEIP